MKNLTLLKELEKTLIVNKATIKKILGCGDAYAYTVLSRLKEKGILKQIQKGKYTTLDDIHAIATNLYTPSYLCLWSASSYKGYTEQILREIQVAVTKKHKEREFNNYQIKPIKFPQRIFFGFQKIQNNNFDIFVAEDEKLLIDSLIYPDEMGNPQEIKKVYQNAEINEEKLTRYLKKINNASLTKRCGFLLEKTRGIDIWDDFRIKDRNYVNLFQKKGGKTNSKWRVKYDI